MRCTLAIVAILGACSGEHGGNPDAASDTVVPDAAVDAPPTCATPVTVNPATASEIAVVGETAAEGIFDPSIIYPVGAMAGAMTYSSVPDQLTIRTHVAVSSDHGATWTMAAEANMPEATSIASSDCGGTCTGNLISEVSSLVYDDTDANPNARWKLFAHRYLVSPGQGSAVVLHYVLGTIALQTAPAPSGPWSAPQKLIGWNHAGSTYSSTGVVANVSTLAGTAQDCLALTEPGALVLPDAIDLAVGCVYLVAGDTQPHIRVELLRSPDHGATWGSVGTLVRPEDAAGCFGATTSINGADLFVENGHEYVSATPTDSLGYHGCLVFPIDDPATGAIRRDATNHAVVTHAITAAQFDGACTYAEATGYVMDVGFLTDARKFRMFSAP